MAETNVDGEMKYENDKRPICQYGIKCYQKNPFHRNKYKHPSKSLKKIGANEDVSKKASRKRKNDDRDGSVSPEERKRECETRQHAIVHDLSSDEDKSNDENDEHLESKNKEEKDAKVVEVQSNKNSENFEATENSESLDKLDKMDEDKKLKILEIFSFNMPNDFYRLHDFCTELSKDDPANALKIFKLSLVGPYDVLIGKLASDDQDDKEKYLRHWKYYYDPPEFQTVIKGDDKSGLHFGYWRDDPAEDPVFVAINKAAVNCIIQPVAENIFGAISAHMETQIKTANPFEKNNMVRLQKRLKTFANNLGITLEQNTVGMKSREKKVVARTFHKAGIVVPFDKKTLLGYRDLAASDSALKRILEAIDASTDDDNQRKAHLAKLDEVVRLATIAADECDFGTCLELAHDLFASGLEVVENRALRMFKIAYTQLGRTKFYDVARAHLKSRARPR